MRVAQVTSYFQPHIGGVETHVRELSARLRRRGVEVTVICANTDGAPPREEIDGVQVIRVPPRGLFWKTPTMPGATEAVLAGGFDLVHSHLPPPLASWRAARASRRAKIPHVMTFHCDPEIPTPLGALVVDAWRLTLGHSTLRRTDHLISTTASYASTSRLIWNYTPTVIPPAVDPEVFRPGAAAPRVSQKLPGAPGFRILFVGRLVEHKGIEQLIEAAALLPAPAHLIIAGQGDRRADLERRARASRASSRISFLGRVDQGDLPDLYRACDVFALPSVSRLEAFGIVALEAMASGLPVVASDLPGVREVVSDGKEGYLANPLDPAGFSQKLDALLSSPLRRARYGRNGRAKVLQEFGWDLVLERILAIYEELTAAKAGKAPASAGAKAAVV